MRRQSETPITNWEERRKMKLRHLAAGAALLCGHVGHGAGAAGHRVHRPLGRLEHLLAGGAEGLRGRLRQACRQLPDGLRADRRLGAGAGGQHGGRDLAAAGRADHLDRRQQRLRRRDPAGAGRRDHRHRLERRRPRGREGQRAAGLHRPGLRAGGLHAGAGAVEEHAGRGRPPHRWSASRRPGRTGPSSARSASPTSSTSRSPRTRTARSPTRRSTPAPTSRRPATASAPISRRIRRPTPTSTPATGTRRSRAS